MNQRRNSAVEFSVADFPGLTEAVAREQHIRRIACLGIRELVCGCEVLPLTAAHVQLLTLTRSPFLASYPVAALCAKPDIADDILRLLWIVSPMYLQGSVTSPPLKRKWFESRKHLAARVQAAQTNRDGFNAAFARIMQEPVDKVVTEILAYIEESFLDAGNANAGGKSYYAEDIAIAYEFSKHHGYRLDFWNPDCPREKNPLHVPLKIVFQLRKARAQFEHGRDAAITNPSDKFIEEGLAEIGRRRARLAEYERELNAEKVKPFPPGVRFNFDLN
jgi:hypothetical protein